MTIYEQINKIPPTEISKRLGKMGTNSTRDKAILLRKALEVDKVLFNYEEAAKTKISKPKRVKPKKGAKFIDYRSAPNDF